MFAFIACEKIPVSSLLLNIGTNTNIMSHPFVLLCLAQNVVPSHRILTKIFIYVLVVKQFRAVQDLQEEEKRRSKHG